jgi:hypothetical protein
VNVRWDQRSLDRSPWVRTQGDGAAGDDQVPDDVTYQHLMQLKAIEHASEPAQQESDLTFPLLTPGPLTPVTVAADSPTGVTYLSLLQPAQNLSMPEGYYLSRADVPAVVDQVTLTLASSLSPLPCMLSHHTRNRTVSRSSPCPAHYSPPRPDLSRRGSRWRSGGVGWRRPRKTAEGM